MKDYGNFYEENYLKFVGSESYKHQIDIWYRAYNISREKLELYYDFLMSLYEIVSETDLGTDVLLTEEDQRNHFTWCWDKNLNNFNQEKIHFKERGDHFEYLLNLFLDAYYITLQYNEQSKIPEYIYKLFSFKHVKTRSELDILTELYKLLNINLKK